MRTLAMLILCAAAVACGQREEAGYPPQYEYNFMRACEAGPGPDAICGCVWREIEANIEPDDFHALERLPADERDAHPLQAQINGYVLACQPEPESAEPGEPAPGE